MKYLLIFSALISVWCYYLNYRIDILKEEKNRLETENKSLKINNERIIKNEMEVRKQNESLKSQIAKDRSGFDWYYDLSDNPVRLRVSNECLSCDRAD